MKTLALTLLSVVMLCVAPATADLNVVTTLSTFSSIAEEIGGENIKVSYIAPPKFNPHFIEPRPSDVLKVKRAEVFVHAGLDLELWRQPLLNAAGNREVMPGGRGDLDLAVGIALLEIPTRALSRAEGDIHLFGNPHYWLDPHNAKILASTIANKFTVLDPANGAAYAQNLRAFHASLDKKMVEWAARMAPYEGYEVLGYHRQWPYLMAYLGLRMTQYLEPKPGVPPGPKQLSFLTQYAESSGVHGIVQAVYFSDRASKTLAKRTGLTLVKLSQNVGDTPAATDYVGMLEYNVAQLTSMFEGSVGTKTDTK